jgi:site-specific DNA-methyltransferase (adenine-specific)
MMPYYKDDQVTLYHGDCLEILPDVSGVDLIVTSPPYNLGVSSGSAQKWGGNWKGIDYDSHEDAMPEFEYRQWQRSVLTACWGTLTESGAIFYNHRPKIRDRVLWTPLELNPNLPIRQIIVWARSGGLNYTTTYYVPTHEWIIVFAKDQWRLKSKGASGVGDLWKIHQETNSSHPAPFPIGLPARAIETTKPTLVLDPFAGSGTTLRAASNAGVRSIGIEKSERYCELVATRLNQMCLDFGEGA